jgi:hypothetical protein
VELHKHFVNVVGMGVAGELVLDDVKGSVSGLGDLLVKNAA